MKKNYIKPAIEVITPVLESEVLGIGTAASNGQSGNESLSNKNDFGFDDEESETKAHANQNDIWE